MFVADRFHTMDPRFPVVEAVAVRAGRVVTVGSLDTVVDALGAAPFVIDEALRGSVVVPGLIDQHPHPLLGQARWPPR